MLKLAIVRIVDLSTRYPWWVIVVALTFIVSVCRLCRAAFRYQDGHQRAHLARPSMGEARSAIRQRISAT